METRIGTCSLCGGDVFGHTGAWWGVVPPPPPKCRKCGAVSAQHDDTIPMVRPHKSHTWTSSSTAPTTLPLPLTTRADEE